MGRRTANALGWAGRGRDVLDAMVWIPVVTFWQVTVDLPLATGVPAGHGHPTPTPASTSTAGRRSSNRPA